MVLTQAHVAGTLLGLMSAIILQYNRSTSITALSDQTIVPLVIERWIGGATFIVILQLLVEADIRIGGNNRYPTVEDAVAICEGGLGYEGAMILATIADLAEGDAGELPGAIALLQRQMKCGLPSLASLVSSKLGSPIGLSLWLWLKNSRQLWTVNPRVRPLEMGLGKHASY